jgi:hypothetical protein
MASEKDDVESGYVSGAASTESLPDVYFTKTHLKFLNQQLQNLDPPGSCLSADSSIALESILTFA